MRVYIWRPVRDHIGIYSQENKIGLIAVGRFINKTNGKYFKKAALQVIPNNLKNPLDQKFITQ